MKEQEFDAIIERVENVRKTLGLNKARFSTKIGMKAQSYNNFIGAQGSKPNVALIAGIVDAFKVNPQWLLSGSGNMLDDKVYDLREPTSAQLQSPSRAPRPPDKPVEDLRSVRTELEMMLRPYRSGSMPTLNRAALRQTQMQMAVQMLTHLFHASPVDTTAQIIQMLDGFQRIASEMELGRPDDAKRPNADPD